MSMEDSLAGKREHPEKLKRWQEITESVDSIYGIEPGIKDAVRALVALGLPTVDSCEGHLDHARVAPRVVIEAPNRPRTAEGEYSGESTPEYLEWRKRNDVLLKKAQGILDDFYKGREVGENIRIVCDSPNEDYWGDIVLHNGGTDYVVENLGVKGAVEGETESEGWERMQAIVAARGEGGNKELAERIALYQKEFQEFAEYLKQRYFSEEPESASTPQEEDLHDKQTVSGILEEGDAKQLARVAQALGKSIEEISLASQFAKLRREIIDESERETEQRAALRPEPTEEELNAGAYRERLEPQVRDIVFRMRQKGYQTTCSGFSGFLGQSIQFENESMVGLNEFRFSTGLLEWATALGAEMRLTEGEVSVHFKKFVDLKTLSEIWRRIGDELPDLGRAAAPCQLKQAEDFRTMVGSV